MEMASWNPGSFQVKFDEKLAALHDILHKGPGSSVSGNDLPNTTPALHGGPAKILEKSYSSYTQMIRIDQNGLLGSEQWRKGL